MGGRFRGSASRPPVLLRLRSSSTFITLTVATCIFTDIFVYGIVVPVFPFALSTRAHVNPAHIQTWISIFLAIYGAALLATAPFMGWIADRISSRQIPLVGGMLALGGATALLCVGDSIAVFAVARTLQGVSAAVVWIVGLALLVDTVGPDDVGQAMGYVGLSMSLAMLVAPLLGGVVFAAAGYYAVFAMAFGLIGLDIVLRLLIIEKKFAVKWLPAVVVETDQTTADPTSMKVGSDSRPEIEKAGMPSTDAAETWSEPRENPAEQTKAAVDEAKTTAVDTATTPSRTTRLPPVIYLLASRRLLSALWATVIQSSILTAFDTILPLYVKKTFHWNSIGAGLVFLPIVVVSFCGPVVGHLVDRHGPRWYATLGFVLACPSIILLRLVQHNTLPQKVLLCALLALAGVGLTTGITPIMAEITYAVNAKSRTRPPGFFGKYGAYAQAYSLFNMAWAAGCLVGPLLAGLVNQHYGWGTTTTILGCVSLVTAVPTAIWTGGSIFKKARRKREMEAATSSGAADAPV